jgi:hypothetical protein
MASQDDPRQKDGAGSKDAQGSPPAEPVNVAPASGASRQEIAETVNSILRGIPIFGPYVVLVKLKFGWSGILLSLSGFFLAVILIYIGLLPAAVVADKYKNSTTAPAPNEGRDYELKSNPKAVLEDVVKNAKSSVQASGIALMSIDPGTVAEKIKSGVNVELVYTNPCGELICRRMKDENSMNAQGNVRRQLSRLNDYYSNKFDEGERGRLHVYLSDSAYPTMIVTIIDNRDLYAYFCPYADVCTASPMLVLKDYKDEKRPQNGDARFFEKHFNAVRGVSAPLDFKKYDFDKPCPCASPAPAESHAP